MRILVTEHNLFIPDGAAPQEVEIDRDGTVTLVDYDMAWDDMLRAMGGEQSPKRRLLNMIQTNQGPLVFLVTQSYVLHQYLFEIFEEYLRVLIEDASRILPGSPLFGPHLSWLDGRSDHIPTSAGVFCLAEQSIEEAFGTDPSDDRQYMSTYVGWVAENIEKACEQLEAVRDVVDRGDEIWDPRWFVDTFINIAENIERSCGCISPRPCGAKATGDGAERWLLSRVIDFMEAEEADA